MAFTVGKLWVALAICATSTLAAPYTARDSCDKAAVLKVADAYVATQTAGTLDALHAVAASNWTYQENNKEADPKKGVLVKALKIDHRRTIVDLVQCASYTELISANAANPYVIGTQIRHNSDYKATMVDSIASTTHSWLFNAAKTLQYASAESWDPIPEGKRDSRELIQAAGDLYLDEWSSSSADAKIPWGTPCNRLEGGAYTGSGKPTDSCKVGVPSNHNQAPNTHRRYVIDESMGSVSILCSWEHTNPIAADSHEFRLENGKLRYIHTMTTCGDVECRIR